MPRALEYVLWFFVLVVGLRRLRDWRERNPEEAERYRGLGGQTAELGCLFFLLLFVVLILVYKKSDIDFNDLIAAIPRALDYVAVSCLVVIGLLKLKSYGRRR